VRFRRAARRGVLGLQVVLLFAVVEIGLRTVALPQLCARLHIRFGTPPTAHRQRAPTASRWTATEALAAVRYVSERWPWGDTCLRKCLVLGTLLRRAEPTLVLGVRKSTDGDFGAHAWLEFNGVSIDGMSAEFSTVSQ